MINTYMNPSWFRLPFRTKHPGVLHGSHDSVRDLKSMNTQEMALVSCLTYLFQLTSHLFVCSLNFKAPNLHLHSFPWVYRNPISFLTDVNVNPRHFVPLDIYLAFENDNWATVDCQYLVNLSINFLQLWEPYQKAFWKQPFASPNQNPDHIPIYSDRPNKAIQKWKMVIALRERMYKNREKNKKKTL